MKPSARNFGTKYIQGKPPASQLMKMKNLVKLQVFYFDFCWWNFMFHYGDCYSSPTSHKKFWRQTIFGKCCPFNALKPTTNISHESLHLTWQYWSLVHPSLWTEWLDGSRWCVLWLSNNGSYSATNVSSTYLPRMLSPICMFDWLCFISFHIK